MCVGFLRGTVTSVQLLVTHSEPMLLTGPATPQVSLSKLLNSDRGSGTTRPFLGSKGKRGMRGLMSLGSREGLRYDRAYSKNLYDAARPCWICGARTFDKVRSPLPLHWAVRVFGLQLCRCGGCHRFRFVLRSRFRIRARKERKGYLEHVKKLVLPISVLRIFNKLRG